MARKAQRRNSRITETEYQQIIDNSKWLKSLQQSPQSNTNSVTGNNKRNQNSTIYSLINNIDYLNLGISTSHSSQHFSLVLDGLRLLTLNQLFALNQNKKYLIFKYKKRIHQLIHKILLRDNAELIIGQVEVTLYRQAPKLVDEDAMSAMFKYIIDALKHDKEHGHGIIIDDNRNVIKKIKIEQQSGDYLVGIKIVKTTSPCQQTFSVQDILDQSC